MTSYFFTQQVFVAASLIAVITTSCAPSASTSHAKEFTAQPLRIEEPAGGVATLAIGQPAPDFRLPGTDGDFHTLAEYKDAKALLLIFTCNHCPTAQAYEDRMIDLHRDYQAQGVTLIAVSPNSPLGLLPEELGYSDLGDSYKEMIIRAKDRPYPFPYLYDGDTHSMAIQYGPVATPHAFLFDQDRKLRYQGRLDGSEKPGTAQSEDLRAALDAVLQGQPVTVAETKTFGCSVKWAWKDEYRHKVDADWAALPVEVAPIDGAGVRQLLANESEKLRLVNLWATWCGPCVIEFPDLVETHRMFKGRDFEFVSLSADKPEKAPAVEKFLKEQHAAFQNYHFSSPNQDSLLAAIDPQWNGALPYTLLIAPGGEIVFRQAGVVDLLKLRRAIVDHPMIGRYF